jgi:hypothetical protein
MTTATSASSLAAVNNPWILMAQRTLAQFTAVSKPGRRSQVSVSLRAEQFLFNLFNERFIAPINIKTYMLVTKLFLNYNQFTTVS